MSLYSYTRVRPKHLLKNDTKLWIFFILLAIFIFVAFNFFITYKTNLYESNIKELKSTQISLKKEIIDIESQIDVLRYQKNFSENIFAKNIIIKNSIKNLFDLIPDEITLNKIEISKNELVLYGVTATKEIFQFLLDAPLKSIFNYSNTFFYLTKNGWYNFVSTNKIDKEVK